MTEGPMTGDHWYFEGNLYEVADVLNIHNGSTGVFLRDVLTGKPYPVELERFLRNASLFHRIETS